MQQLQLPDQSFFWLLMRQEQLPWVPLQWLSRLEAVLLPLCWLFCLSPY